MPSRIILIQVQSANRADQFRSYTLKLFSFAKRWRVVVVTGEVEERLPESYTSYVAALEAGVKEVVHKTERKEDAHRTLPEYTIPRKRAVKTTVDTTVKEGN